MATPTLAKVRAVARVKVEIEIEVGSAWGTGCSIEQVYKQASEDAIGAIYHACEKSKTRQFRVIGKPMVSAVIVEDKP